MSGKKTFPYPLTYEGTPHEHRDRELVAMTDIIAQYREDNAKYYRLGSAQEGRALINEALTNLDREIYSKTKADRDPEEIRKRAVKLAVAAMRFIVDVCMTEAWKA